MEHGILFALCRLIARIATLLGLEDDDGWGTELTAIEYYRHFRPEEAIGMLWMLPATATKWVMN